MHGEGIFTFDKPRVHFLKAKHYGPLLVSLPDGLTVIFLCRCQKLRILKSQRSKAGLAKQAGAGGLWLAQPLKSDPAVAVDETGMVVVAVVNDSDHSDHANIFKVKMLDRSW